MNTTIERSGEPGAAYSVARLWLVVRSNVLPIVIVVFLTCAAAIGATFMQPVHYVSHVTLVVRNSGGAGDIETITRTMSALLRSQTTGDDIRKSGVNLSAIEVAGRISVERPPGSGVLEVSITDSDQARGKQIASVIVPVFAKRAAHQLGPERSVQAWDTNPDTQTIPRPLARNGVVAFILGAVLGAFVVALRDRFSPTVTGMSETEALLGMPVLGSLPNLDGKNSVPPIEEMRAILSAAQSDSWSEIPRSVLVAGPASALERATFSLVLAVTLADAGHKVMLIDADLANRDLTRRVRLTDTNGFADALFEDLDLSDVAITVDTNDMSGLLEGAHPKRGFLAIVPAGRNDSTSLASSRVRTLLAQPGRGVTIIVNGPADASQGWNLIASVESVLTVIAEGTNTMRARELADIVRGRPGSAAVVLSSSRLEVRPHVVKASSNGTPRRVTTAKAG